MSASSNERALARRSLLLASASFAVLILADASGSGGAFAQQAEKPLPPITVEQQTRKPPARGAPSSARSGQKRRAVAAAQPGSVGPVTPTVGASGLRNSSPTDYKLDNATTATKTNTSILNTPMAVQIIPRAALDDKQVITPQEAVKFVSGVQMPTTPYYDNFLIRGFDNGGNTYRNGLHLYGIVGFEDIAFVDHIEIAKGPTAMLYGRVQPGGLVNYVTRKPDDIAAYSVQQQLGSWGQISHHGGCHRAARQGEDGALSRHRDVR